MQKNAFTFLKLLSPRQTELPVTDLGCLEIPAADELDILLDKALLRIEQFALDRETNISEDEQIVWHINAALPQPLENYFYAYQVYTREENKIQGLFCVLEKTALAKITGLTSQRIRVYSADRQFLLYANQVPFWQIETYLRRLLKLSQLLLGILVALGLLLSPVLFFWQQRLSAENTRLQTEKQDFQNQLRNLQNYERAQNSIQKNKALNQNLSNYLRTVSLQIPDRVYFRKLFYAGQTVQIDGYCAQDKELKALQKALKTESGLKPELARLSKEEFIYFSLRTDLKKLLAKETKNVQLAKK